MRIIAFQPFDFDILLSRLASMPILNPFHKAHDDDEKTGFKSVDRKRDSFAFKFDAQKGIMV